MSAFTQRRGLQHASSDVQLLFLLFHCRPARMRLQDCHVCVSACVCGSLTPTTRHTFTDHSNHCSATAMHLFYYRTKDQRRGTIAKFRRVPSSCLIFLLKQQRAGFGFHLSFFFHLQKKNSTHLWPLCAFKCCSVSLGETKKRGRLLLAN